MTEEKSTIRTLDELNNILVSDCITMIQFSAPWCARCPSFTKTMQQLKQEYTFAWYYAELPDADELKEEFEIVCLPALVILKDDQNGGYRTIDIQQSLSVETAQALVNQHCSKLLVLDADF